MKLTQVVVAAIHVCLAAAYALQEASIKVNSKAIHFGEISTQEIKSLAIESSKDKLDISIKLKDDLTSVPHQAVIILGDDNGLEYPLFPKVNVQSRSLRSVSVISKLPSSIKSLDKIHISAIVASPGEKNLYLKLGELAPSDKYREQIGHKKPARVGIQPEIAHTFREDPATVNAIFPIVFSGVGVALFVGLLGSWVHLTGRDFFGTFKNISAGQLANNASFLSLLVAYEFLFIQYYLGLTIFKVIAYSAILAGPTIFLGSRTFRWLAHLRKIGKA